MMKTLLTLALAATTFFSGLALAQQSPISFANIAQKQVVTVDENGEETISLTDVGIVVPGDAIVYTSTFTNSGAEEVSNIVIDNPIPADTKYIRFSAQGEKTEVTFSIDGGQNFAAPAELTITEANGVTRAAKPEEYTDIRWVYQGSLAAGSASSVNFKVTIL
jgi:uncharacterized repeat protein (TIGR01451 family)